MKPRYNAILTEPLVAQIKRLLDNTDISYREIARLYAVSKSCISDIAKGKTWADVPPATDEELEEAL